MCIRPFVDKQRPKDFKYALPVRYALLHCVETAYISGKLLLLNNFYPIKKKLKTILKASFVCLKQNTLLINSILVWINNFAWLDILVLLIIKTACKVYEICTFSYFINVT